MWKKLTACVFFFAVAVVFGFFARQVFLLRDFRMPADITEALSGEQRSVRGPNPEAAAGASVTSATAEKANAASTVSHRGSVAVAPTIPDGGISYSYLMSDKAANSNFGNLKDLRCVCGCAESDEIRNLTQVKCAFLQEAPTVCTLQRALFYGSEPVAGLPEETVFFGAQAPRFPLVVAVCDAAPGYEDLLSSAKRWSAHNNFGVTFDHVSEHRIINLPSQDACRDAAATCTVPKSFQWGGSTARWIPAQWDDANLAWSDIPVAPQLGPSASVAYIDSADCWLHNPNRGKDGGVGEPINPWHCNAIMLNWNVLSGLFEAFPRHFLGTSHFSRTDAKLFALQGYDEFFIGGQPNGHLSGWHAALAAAGGGFEPNFHDDDHAKTKLLQADRSGTKGYAVSLQGILPMSVANAAPESSFIWGIRDKRPDERPSQVIVDFRVKVLEQVDQELRTLLSEHPLETLRNNYPNHIKWILPDDPDTRKEIEESFRADFDRWQASRKEWSSTVLPKLALVWRRSPFGGAPVNRNTCKRCLTNIEEIVQAVANEFNMVVLLMHPVSQIPSCLQLYAIYATKLLVAMHGGAWGAAAGMQSGQAAVEIVPAKLQINAQHFVRLGGAASRLVRCADCDRNRGTGSGKANVEDVLSATRQALEEASQVTV